MNFKIDLPKAADWNPSDNYAENLRETKVAGIIGCVPVGTPKILAENAGVITEVLPGGDILSAGDDRHDIFLNGKAAGSLGSPLAAILPQGNGEALLFTPDGVEIFADGKLQDGAPSPESVSFSMADNAVSIAEQVVLPDFKGSYPRPYGPLAETDNAAVTKAVDLTLKQLDSHALAAGKWTQPVWVAWRMTDSEGRIIRQSAPVRIGSVQGNAALSFNASHSESSMTVTGSAAVKVNPFGIRIRIAPSASQFWQKRVAAIEVVACDSPIKLTAVTGTFTQVDSSSSSLTVKPVITELGRDSSAPYLIVRIASPLASGVDSLLTRSNESPCDWLIPDTTEPILPSALCAAGTITAYALADKPGTLAVASGNDPLLIRASRRICMSEILRITPPAGTSGGWNYGRHHLLAFTIDGIYAVSVDSSLRTISSSRLAPLGIERADAVAVSPEAIYVASIAGTLLRLKGTRIEPLKMPLTPKAVCRNVNSGELWVAPDYGCPWVLNDSGGVSLRTDITVTRFVEPAMAVDASGRLRNLADEDSNGETYVAWRRREICEVRKQMRKALWVIDSERASDLSMQILADSGGAPQRLLELTANGPINAPIDASFSAPRRAFYSARLRGTLRNPSRLLQLTITP